MRRFRSVSDYLSLGAGPAERKPGPLLGARVQQGPAPFEQRDLVVAETITVAHIRKAVREMRDNGIPGDYAVSLPPRDMTALLSDPEFQAAEASGEITITGKGALRVRIPEAT